MQILCAPWSALPRALGTPPALQTPGYAAALPARWLHASPPRRDGGPAAEGDDLRRRVLDAALGHVNTLGWRKAALEAAAADLGLSPAVAGSFEGGAADLVAHFNAGCNVRLREELAARAEELAGLSVRERLVLGLRLRLEMVVPMAEGWADALAAGATPAALRSTLGSYADIADVVWRAAGDKSTEAVGWYGKRAALAAVYASGELALLGDGAADFSDTWAYLDRRIRDMEGMGLAST